MKTRKAGRDIERRKRSEEGGGGRRTEQDILELKNKVHLLEKRRKPQVNVQEKKKKKLQ